jgi:hypothetical protein
MSRPFQSLLFGCHSKASWFEPVLDAEPEPEPFHLWQQNQDILAQGQEVTVRSGIQQIWRTTSSPAVAVLVQAYDLRAR